MSTRTILITALFCLSIHQLFAAVISPTTTTLISEEFNTASASEFLSDSITCTKSICNVICDTSNGCQSASIYASSADTFTLTCSGYRSCYNINVYSGGSTSTTISCTGDRACYSSDFTVYNSPLIDITCDYTTTSSSDAACSSANIYARSSTYSSNLTVTCDSDYACYNLDIHCPSGSTDKCDISCGSSADRYSCRSMNIFIPNEQTNLNLDCGSSSTQNACYGSGIYCGTSISADSSSLVYSSSASQFRCSTPGCCPDSFYDGIRSCSDLGQNGVCTIDCINNQCSDYLIDGSNVITSLTVNCASTNGGCKTANIKCPDTYSSATCTVNCQDASLDYT